LKTIPAETIQKALAATPQHCVLTIYNGYWPDIQETETSATGTYNISMPDNTVNCSLAFNSVMAKFANIPSQISINTTITSNTTLKGDWLSTIKISTQPTKPTIVLYIIIGVITAVALIITIVLIVSLNRKRDDGYGPVVDDVDEEKYRDDPY
jgi:hypothetical protein